MAIDKLTPRYLNFEDDERLVKRVEMTDAVNIRIDSDDDGNAGVVKNVAGNTLVTFIENDAGIPSGDNKVIGSVHNNGKAEILFFVWNSAQKHRIYKYDDNLEKVITVYKNEATGTVASASADTLGFKATDYVDAAVLVDKDGDTLLYFTNGRGEPKKINVDKAIRGDYPTGYEAVEAYISLIKKPPLEPPTFVFESDPEISNNRFLGKQFQFACQYVYEDGEVSAISPISKVTKSINHQDVGIAVKGTLNEIDNKVVITCKKTNSDIKKIRFLAREGNDGVFFIIEDKETQFSSTATDSESIEFANEKAYTPISNNENNKQFDAVGENVKTITISGNRVFLSNYTEGFDLKQGKENNIKIEPNYHALSDVLEVNQPDDLFATTATTNAFGNGMFTGYSNSFTNDNHKFTGFGGRIAMHTDLDFGLIGFGSNSDFNRYRSFDFSGTFSNIHTQYGNGQELNGQNTTGSDGIQSKLSPLRIVRSIPLTGNYSSYTDVLDAIVDDINSLGDFTLGVIKGGGALDDGGEYSGTMDVKVVARRNFSHSVLGGSDKITLFLEPKSVSVDSELNPANFRNINITFSHPKMSTSFGFFSQNIVNGGNSKAGFGSGQSGCIFLGTNFNCVGFFNEPETTSSFKAGANHAFGIVYQDKNGRLSTVRPIGEKNVEWFDSPKRRGNTGKTSMVVRIPSTELAPENATRWFPVYAGNTDVGNFIQYTVNDAFAPVNDTDADVPSGVTISQKLYVSARGFQGKENSYIETFNPEISYTYAQGDVMKILSVNQDRGESKEFRVLDYRDIGETNNPLTTSTSFNDVDGFEKTGNFFVIQKPTNENDFDGATTNLFRDKCLVEIRTPKFSSDNQVYFQLGESYEIENRVHKGVTRTASLANAKLNGGPIFYRLETDTRAYIGDKISISGISPPLFTVTNVQQRGDKFLLSLNAINLSTFDASSVTATVQNITSENVVELDSGDVYFRKRLLNYGFASGSTNESFTYVDYIEDYRFTDFISTVSNDFGKPNAYSEDAGRVHRNSSITYSDAYVMDSDRLSLSSFNNSLANFLDIKNKYGAIQRMVDIEDAFYAVQEHKVTLFPVNRNVLQSAAGDATVTLSTDVVNLNSSKSFAGDYGCGNDPEAVVYYEGVLYFVDRKANKVFSISSSGIREISDIFADSYIADKLSGADKGGEYNIYSGIDPNNDEYLLSTRTIVNKTISVDQGSLYVLPANSGVGQADFTPHSVNSTTFGNFNLLNFNFEDVDVNFEDMGNGVLYVDDGFSDNAMQLDTPVDNLTSGTSNIVYTDKDNTFLGVAQVDNTNKFVTIV
jgi:hypothetical protein